MLGELLAAVSNCKKRAKGYSQSIQEDEQLLWATIARSQDHFLYTAPQLMWLQPSRNLV